LDKLRLTASRADIRRSVNQPKAERESR
jgi:hypothetical protein